MSVTSGITAAAQVATSSQEIDRKIAELQAGAGVLAVSSIKYQLPQHPQE